MKKLYFILFALVIGNSVFAQTIANAGMESWRAHNAGGISGDTVVTIHAPVSWYGFDSLVISLGETFGGLIGAGNDWNAQVFPDSVVKHSGSYSAKLITVDQDILGNIPSVLANAQPSINTAELEATMSLSQSTSFSGGTPITGRIASVSAWVQYKLDSALATGPNTATLTVLVYAKVFNGVALVDSIVGSDTVYIHPTSSWAQITANVKYVDSLNGADTVRILFSSSNANAMDSSTLNVDDVSMVYAPVLSVINSTIAQNDVKVYPNPASGTLYIESAKNTGASFQLFAINGQLVATQTLSGKDAIDVSLLADGLYFYTITDVNGNNTQRGKVSVVK